MGGIIPDNVFRANVGAVIVNDSGEVLAFERTDIKDAWQLPQGGIGQGEGALDAVYREVKEETGIDGSNLEFITEYPEWLAYELSEDKRTGKHGRGQVQKWFLFKFTGTENDIDLVVTEGQEFRGWKWTTLKKLTAGAPLFRRPIYSKLLEGFEKYLRM